VRELENQETHQGDKPVKPCFISDCGEIAEGADDGFTVVAADGDSFPMWPEDADDMEAAGPRIKAANEIRLLGNGLFKGGQYAEAAAKYKKAQRYLEAPDATDEEREEILKARVSCLSNSAACNLKTGAFRAAIADTEGVLTLEPTNTKAMFRQGSAYIGVSEFDSAMAVLEKAAGLEPEDKAIANELKKAKHGEAQRKKKEKAQYAKMFG